MVGPSGLEPPTSCLSGTRSNLLSYDPSWLVKWFFTWNGGDDGDSRAVRLRLLCSQLLFAIAPMRISALCSKLAPTSNGTYLVPLGRNSSHGGDDGIRTHDPLLAGQVLSQLSYTPILFTPRFCTVPSFGFCFSLPFSNPRSGFYSTPQVSVSIELSSRTVARKVLSPLQSLTSVFGMGTGGPSAFVTLTFFNSQKISLDPWKLNNILSKSPSRSSSNR